MNKSKNKRKIKSKSKRYNKIRCKSNFEIRFNIQNKNNSRSKTLI